MDVPPEPEPAPAPEQAPGPEGVTFRRPTEADYPAIIRVIDDWWGGRNLSQLLPRLWLQHFTGTSWLAETPDGRIAGFLVGFLSPDHPDTAYCHMIATNPNLRQRGLGRALYERFFADARAAGRSVVNAVTWPGNRVSIAFHRAIGFDVAEGPGSQRLYGTPAQPEYDFDREDRAILVRTI
jgi:ribosomal protein S18 acetylase RimI-like enzyme